MKPCLENVFKCFQGYEHELKFMENCLPFWLPNQPSFNFVKEVDRFGKLAAFHYGQNNEKDRNSLKKLFGILEETDSDKLEQMLRFLSQHP